MSSEATLAEMHEEKESSQLWFWLTLLGLFLLRVAMGFVGVSPALAQPLTFVTAAIIMGASFFALFQGAKGLWTALKGFIFIGIGVLLHGGGIILMNGLKLQGAPGVFVEVFIQMGVLIWCMGLGALVAILIKEKNLILPVAIFLAGFDAFLILTPTTPMAQIAQKNPEIVGNIGMTVPQVKVQTPDEEPKAGIVDLAYAGPADLFFAATFFVCLYRYKMKAKKTALILGPILFLYLILVMSVGIPLPALVPIGLTVLLVNAGEFKLKKDEKLAVGFVALIALGLAGFGLYKRATYKPPAEEETTLELPGGTPPPELQSQP
ncbi:MAG: hypothetical protein KDC26_03940 [Armatimonadetes bacterium]|nr:hypothetical protein [Armatimonadota bacterium]